MHHVFSIRHVYSNCFTFSSLSMHTILHVVMVKVSHLSLWIFPCHITNNICNWERLKMRNCAYARQQWRSWRRLSSRGCWWCARSMRAYLCVQSDYADYSRHVRHQRWLPKCMMFLFISIIRIRAVIWLIDIINEYNNNWYNMN